MSRSLDWAHLAPSIDNMTHYVSNTFVTPSGQSYSAVCFYATAQDHCFTEVSSQASGSQTVTLSFVPGTHEEFTNALMTKTFYPADSFGVEYRLQSRPDESIGEMNRGPWIAYAARALIMRFWELAKVSQSDTTTYHVLSHLLDSRKRIRLTFFSSLRDIF